MLSRNTIIAISALSLLPVVPASAQFTPQLGIPPTSDGGDSRSVNWTDVDDDGDLDLFISNSGNPGAANFLYRNDGTVWVKITTGDIVTDISGSVGACWADFDNDGDPDGYVTNWYGQRNQLYVNDGGWNFTSYSGAHPVTDARSSEDCAWIDYDNDGWLDLFVTNSGGSGEVNHLYRGDGAGGFTKITTGAIVTDSSISRGCAWGDYDNDGDLDLFVANELGRDNQLYDNQGDGTFAAVTIGPHVNDGGDSMSANWVDWDNDRDLDLFVANEHNEYNFLYRNDGDAGFARIATGAVAESYDYSYGSIWADWDNDGDQDLLVATAYFPNHTSQMFRNEGGGVFTEVFNDVTAASGWHYGSGFADVDGDGDLDLACARLFNGSDNSLYDNDGNLNHWLRLHLVGTVSNRDAIGARVEVRAVIDGVPRWQLQEVTAKPGYAAQSALDPHFGVGDAAQADTVRIRWPSGAVDILTNVAADNVLTVVESVIAVSDEAPHPALRVLGCTPNPFNPQTRIRFALANPSWIEVTVHDARGHLLRRLYGGVLAAGDHERVWDGRDGSGRRLAAGVYFARVASGAVHEVAKMVLLP